MEEKKSDSSVVTAASTQKAAAFGGGVLAFQPPDKMAIHQSYMPFLKNGGLYIPTQRRYDIGSEVFILVRFPEGNERMPGVGSVVWVNRTPSVSKPSGIGLHFSDTPENENLRSKIEAFIAGISEDSPTFTM